MVSALIVHFRAINSLTLKFSNCGIDCKWYLPALLSMVFVMWLYSMQAQDVLSFQRHTYIVPMKKHGILPLQRFTPVLNQWNTKPIVHPCSDRTAIYNMKYEGTRFLLLPFQTFSVSMSSTPKYNASVIYNLLGFFPNFLLK